MLTRGSQEETGQSPTMQPSANFSLCILVWNLILDLVCVSWVAAGHRAERGRVPAAFNHPPAGLHLYVQASLHAAHLHVLVQVSVHVTLCCGQFHLKEDNKSAWKWPGCCMTVLWFCLSVFNWYTFFNHKSCRFSVKTWFCDITLHFYKMFLLKLN